MNVHEIIQASADEAEAMSREAFRVDHMKGFRDALALGPFKRPMSDVERAAWADLRRLRRLIVETVRMLHQAYWGSIWHRLEDDLDDLRFERNHAMQAIRRARYAHKRMGR